MSRTKKTPGPDYLIKVARLRYEEKLNNIEVAERLGVGPKKAKELLERSGQFLLEEHKRLSEAGVGERIQDVLEMELKQRFGFLKRVVIAPGGKVESEEDYGKLIRRWAIAAANHFDEVVNSGKLRDKEGTLRVSMTGGETILETMTALDDHPRQGVYFYSGAFLGRGRMHGFSHVDSTTNATIAWARSGRLSGHCIYATVSPSESNYGLEEAPLKERMSALRGEVDAIGENSSIANVVRELDEVAVSFAGLGLVTSPKGSRGLLNRLTATSLLRKSVRENELAGEGAVGDMSYCFFDKDGNGRKEWQFFLTAGHWSTPGVEYYREMVRRGKEVIVIAGAYKTPAIRAALKGQLFNVWITDEPTAREILASA